MGRTRRARDSARWRTSTRGRLGYGILHEMRGPLSILLLTAVAFATAPGCVLRPGLAGRACDDAHGCVEGFHCSEGVCVSGDPPSTLADAGQPAGRDGGDVDGGGEVLDGGGEVPDGGGSVSSCPAPPTPDASWLDWFTATPTTVKPGGSVHISWHAPAMDECSLLSPFVPDAPFPGDAQMNFDVPVSRSSTFILRCQVGSVTKEASLVVPVGPAILDLGLAGRRTCVVVEGGVVRCWGDLNGTSLIGGTDGPQVSLGTLESETGDGLYRASLADGDGSEPRARRIILGRYHACAALDDGRLKCFGLNSSGQLGVESRTSFWPSLGWNMLADVRLGARELHDVALGGHHTCVAFAGGEVGCFGSEGSGRLGSPHDGGVGGDPGTMGSALPTLVLDDEAGVAAITAGWSHTCALLDDGRVKCWGLNSGGQLGLGDKATRGDAVGEVGPSLSAVDLGGAASAVAATSEPTCALLADATVKCWGKNRYGALGQGTVDDIGDDPGELGGALAPIVLGAGVVPAQLAVGDDFACVLTPTGEMKCWGNNASGRLGLGDVASRGDAAGEMGDALPFVDVGGAVRRVELGSEHACALLLDGRLKCWGDNQYGQLGLGDDEHRGDGPGEMGEDLPAVDVGSLVPEMFTLEGAMAALERSGCTACHAAALPPASRAAPPLDGCAPELADAGAYPLEGVDPTSEAGARRCFAWHVTEECVEGAAGPMRRIDPTRPEHSLLLRAPEGAGHPTEGRFADVMPGSDHAYLFHWIAGGALR